MTLRPAVALRPASAADIPACADLVDRVQRAFFAWNPNAAYGLAAFKRCTDGEAVTLAWAGAQIVGLVSVYRQESYVHHLYVDGPWHGCGVGRGLLAAGLVDTLGAARLKCDVGNPQGRRFYEHLGWREVARSGARVEDWILFMHDRPERAPA